jgi:nucleoside-diphosphate-sugar epimerase
MVHRTPLPARLAAAPHVEIVRADLAVPATLGPAVAGADAAIHFAGRLFAPRPERFLPETNTRWFANLAGAAVAAGVSRLVLVSFPHVEGPTSPDAPATGRLDRQPISVHATTRLAAERLLMERTAGTRTTPVILRLGMVYGRGILMIEAGRWLARRRLLAVWREPTWYHLLSTIDYLKAAEAALVRPGIEGIYHVGDETPITLQEFLDRACEVWGAPRPWRVPVWSVYAAARLCEAYGLAFRARSPLTRDFITIGRVPHFGDTSRMRRDLLPRLVYPSLDSGLETLK